MVFGVNELVNEGTKQVGIKHNLGFSKVNLLHIPTDTEGAPKVREVEMKTLVKQIEPTTTTSSHDLNISALKEN